MSTLAVVSQSGQTLNFFDISTGERTGQLTDLIAEPHELCYDAKRNLLYISHAYEHGLYWEHGDYAQNITVVDCGKREIVDVIDASPGKGTHGLVLDEHHDMLYASVEGGIPDTPTGGGIIGIDLTSRKVVKAIGSEYTTQWFVMTPDGQKAYTCNKDADFISIIDLEGEKMVGRIDLPGGCEQPSISIDGKWAYFPAPGLSFPNFGNPVNPCVQVIDTTSDQIVKSIPIDYGATAVHVDPLDQILVNQYRFSESGDGNQPKPLDGQLLVLSSEADGHRQIGAVDVGILPLTVFGDGRRAFVSNIFSGTVTVVDLTEMDVQRTLDVDVVRRTDKKYHQGAHGLALLP